MGLESLLGFALPGHCLWKFASAEFLEIAVEKHQAQHPRTYIPQYCSICGISEEDS